MNDIRAAIAEALEARVNAAEAANDPIRYAVAYAAHAAFIMGDDPARAARVFVTSELSPVVEEAPDHTDPMGRATTEVVAIAQAVWEATR
jgi:hypothetical protein